jgi:hypothetical protein
MHYAHPKYYNSMRLGQHFVNRYIKNPWPELFYCEDESRSKAMISTWLMDNQYTDQLPQQVNNTL